jgi:hypothetical protein
MNKVFCCEAFANHVKARTSTSPLAIAYAAAGMAAGDGQIVQDSDGSWSTLGCCGGGCSVLDDMKFCPFCGGKLPTEVLEPQSVETYEDTEEDDEADLKLARERLADPGGPPIPWMPRSSVVFDGHIYTISGGNGDVWQSPDGGLTLIQSSLGGGTGSV